MFFLVLPHKMGLFGDDDDDDDKCCYGTANGGYPQFISTKMLSQSTIYAKL